MGNNSSNGHDPGWQPVTECVDEHRALARKYDVEFLVRELPTRGDSRPIADQPVEQARFLDLPEALAFAQNLKGRVEILVNGSGPYWSSDRPEILNAAILRRVCLRAGLDEETWELERSRAELVDQLARFQVVADTKAIVDAISECETYAEAVDILVEPPLNLDAGLARRVVRDQFRGLTSEGRRELDSILASIAAELEQLPPPAELSD